MIPPKRLKDMVNRHSPESEAELSFVIPVFNGSRSVADVVERIFELYRDLAIEVVLVDDGSRDESEAVCRSLHEKYPGGLTFVHLARNFGEHNAVLAGLHHASGRAVAILDDDGRAMVLLNFNTDMGDGWEWSNAEDYPGYLQYTAQAYRMMINEVVYALTH